MLPCRWRQIVAAGSLVILLFTFACAKKHQKPKLKPKKTGVTRPIPTPVPKIPESLNPRREASQKMISVGQGYLESGEVDKAEQTFQEAINVDPENGVAYYFLAKTDYQKHTYDDALGLLEKAEVLLTNYPDWLREVTRLREMIHEAEQSAPAQTTPAGQEVYY